MKRTSMLLAAILSVFVLSVNALAVDEAPFWQLLPEQSLHTEAALVRGSGVETEAAFNGRYYDQLNSDCKTIYQAIEQTVNDVLTGKAELATAETYLFYDVTATGLENFTQETRHDYCMFALSAYIIDHPREACTLDGYADVLSWEQGEVDAAGHSNVAHIMLYVMDGNVRARVERLDAAVNAFAEQYANDGMATESKLLKYRYIHDYLCDICAYNNDAVDTVAYSDPGYEAYRMAHRAYGALVELEFGSDTGRGSVVCEGYSEAFQLLCQKVGLPCATVDGDGGMSGETLDNNHEWNIIQPYDTGVWYAVDVTWDDGGSETRYSDSNNNLIATVYPAWTYTYFADNRYFVEHEGDPEQNHAAMSQLSYQVNSDDLGLEAPALTAAHLSETIATWSCSYFEAYVESGAKASELNWVIGTFKENLKEADCAKLYLKGNVICDEAMRVAEDEYLELYGLIETPCAIVRGKSFTETMFDVSSGGVLILNHLTLDGNRVTANKPMVLLQDGKDEHRTVLALEDSAVTRSRGAYAVEMGNYGKLYLTGDVTFSDNVINGKAADLQPGNNPLYVMNFDWEATELPCCTNIWDDEKGVYINFFCLEDDATLFCATYTKEGKQVGIESMEFAKGFHTYYFRKLAKDYGVYDEMRFFALRNGTFEPLF